MNKKTMRLGLGFMLMLGIIPASALAQDEESRQYHPILSSRFQLNVGAFIPDKTFKLRVNGQAPGDDIDLSGLLKLDDSETTGAMNFRWRFGEKWSLWGQYWALSDSDGAALDEDIHWRDVVFEEGTFVRGGFESDIGRIFVGRSFLTDRPNMELGVGIGLHWLELSAFMEGEVRSSLGDIERRRASASAGFPLPNIGAWYYYSWSRNWMVGGRVDWLSASIGDYSGGLWNAQVGVDWSPWRHVGFGLFYNFFKLDVDVDKDDWRGSAESTQNGPYVSMTVSW